MDQTVKEEILSLLPAKSLQRFKAVCKTWDDKIRDPEFVRSQSVSHRAHSSFFLHKDGDSPSFISTDLKSCGVPDPRLGFLPGRVAIKSSCNGLLCCQSLDTKSYIICNPATGQWKTLPEANVHDLHLGAALAYEPSTSDVVAHYDLVCPLPASGKETAAIVFEVYSSKTGSWDTFRRTPNLDFVWDMGVYCDSCIHWKKGDRILSYNVVEHVVSDRVDTNMGTLGTANGHLCVARAEEDRFMMDILANGDQLGEALDADIYWAQKYEVEEGDHNPDWGQNQHMAEAFFDWIQNQDVAQEFFDWIQVQDAVSHPEFLLWLLNQDMAEAFFDWVENVVGLEEFLHWLQNQDMVEAYFDWLQNQDMAGVEEVWEVVPGYDERICRVRVDDMIGYEGEDHRVLAVSDEFAVIRRGEMYLLFDHVNEDLFKLKINGDVKFFPYVNSLAEFQP